MEAVYSGTDYSFAVLFERALCFKALNYRIKNVTVFMTCATSILVMQENMKGFADTNFTLKKRTAAYSGLSCR
jgi:hypothetical protein